MRYGLKVACLLIGGGLVAWHVDLASERYAIALDVQKYYSCLPFKMFVVDRRAGSGAERGEMVQFTAPDTAELFSGQFEVVKLVAGIAGDHWQIRDGALYVNGELWGQMHLMSALGLKAGALDGEGVVPEGSVYVLGTTPSSYDSRYWGPLGVEHIVGKASVLF